MGDKKFWKGVVVGILAVLCVFAAGTGVRKAVTTLAGLTNHISGENPQDKLERIDRIIDTYYLYEDEIDEDALTEGMYAGYVEALGDPYSVYYTEEETKELLEGTSGEYSGIGAVLSQDYATNIITIVNVYEDSPAKEAGLLEGDILYQVDDREITDESLSEVVTWIKGDEGTEVILHVLRGNEQLELRAVRRKIEAHTVAYEMKDNQIGYIAVSEFDSVTYDQFKEALDTLEMQGMEGLVIDLRSNPGGNLDTVVEMLKLILPKGTIVSIRDKQGKEDVYACDGKNEFTKPLAVLVNQYSASASEIFAGAVQDYGLGKLVGMTTYGKGIVQQLVPLGDGTYLKLTVAEYFTPGGRNIHGVGINPVIEIEYEPDEENPEADNQLDKALEIINEEIQER